MTPFKGCGTSSSPFTLFDDDGDSENEVMEAIYPGSRFNTASPRPASRPLDPDLTDSVENVRIEESYRSHSAETGLKRKRSESVVSMDQSDDSGDDDGPSGSTSAPAHANGVPPQAQGQSRKAKKRRIKAQAKKEQYLDRLRRLQHNPLLVPQLHGYDPTTTPNTSPFAFLPQFNTQLINPIMPHQPSQDYSFPGGSTMDQTPWSMGGFAVQQPPTFNEQLAWSTLPPVTDFSSHPQAMASAMALDPLLASGQEFYTLPPKYSMKSPDIIGVKPDDDPAGKHGLFEIPKTAMDEDNKPYIPKDPDPARTLVLEQLPKLNRSRAWITHWSLNVSQVPPVEILIDGKGKALIEFPSVEAAQKAWNSPRLGAANLGLKQHLLKGRPRDDLIRAHWYRVDEKSAGGGQEIEEGEIEEASVGKSGVGQQVKKDKNVKIRPSKRPRREEDPRLKARPAMVPQKPGVAQFTLTNGLPARPQPPPPPPQRYPPAPLPGLLTNGDVSYRPTQVNHSDDMDISPTATAHGIPLGPRAMYPRDDPRLNFPKLDVAPPKAASLPSPPNTTPSPAGPDPTALEADLRKRVRETKRVANMVSTLPALPPPPPLPQPLPTPPIVPHDFPCNGALLAAGMDADSFLAALQLRPPPSHVKSKVAPSARELEQAREKAELFAKEAALARELAALRRDTRPRPATDQKRFSPAYTGPGSSVGPIKPSPKLGLDLAPVRSAPWTQIEQPPVVIDSDDEEDEEGCELEADGRDALRV